MTVLKNFFSRLMTTSSFFRFLWAEKLWWLIPMVVALVIVGVIVLLGMSGPIGHFIYSLF